MTERIRERQQYQFGNDLLIAGWSYLLSSLIFYGIMAYTISKVNFRTSSKLLAANVVINFVVSVVYTIASLILLIASLILLIASYELIKEPSNTSLVDIKKLSTCELYFTGNVLLISSWLFFISTLPLLLYPIWGLSTFYLSAFYGAICLILLVLVLSILMLWVVATFPSSLAKGNGQGNSYFYGFFSMICCCTNSGSSKKSFWNIHAGSDYRVVNWVLLVVAIAGFIGSVYYTVLDVKSVISWLWIFSSIFFVIGAYLYLYASYPENEGSSVIYDFIHGIKNEKKGRFQNEGTSDDERQSLVSASIL
jgi:MFS family permease